MIINMWKHRYLSVYICCLDSPKPWFKNCCGDNSLYCYNCSNIDNSLNCITTTKCAVGEKCYSYVSNDVNNPTINLGCKPEHECPISGGPLVGRSIAGDSHFYSCCDQDMCNRQLCPVFQNNTWSDWSPWSPCSSTCGIGLKTRTRSCHDNLDCVGHSTETFFCRLGRCEDNTWSDWSPWSPCSASCDTGLKTRTRYCTQFGGICTGHSVETDFCGRTICLDTSSLPLTTTGSSRYPTLLSTTKTAGTVTFSSPTPTFSSSTPTATAKLSTIGSTPPSSFCRDGPPKLPNAQPTTMSADSVIFKCLKGYAFATGSVFVRINCDDSNKAWKGPFPNCEPKERCESSQDCLNAGACFPGDHRCQCAVGYFGTNCDTEIHVGTQVVRGPDWQDGDQDGNGVGVILRLVDSRVNRIYVRWNTTGIENSYRVGDFGKYDVKPYKPDRLV